MIVTQIIVKHLTKTCASMWTKLDHLEGPYSLSITFFLSFENPTHHDNNWEKEKNNLMHTMYNLIVI